MPVARSKAARKEPLPYLRSPMGRSHTRFLGRLRLLRLWLVAHVHLPPFLASHRS